METQTFQEAISVLTPKLREVLTLLPENVQKETYEIRLRKEKPVVLFGKYGSLFVSENATVSAMNWQSGICLSGQEIQQTVSRICDFSVYRHQNEIAGGFVTFAGGHRAGFCGTAVIRGNGIETLRDITSVNIRKAQSVPDAADDLLTHIGGASGFQSVIIAGAPCTGKTTVLKSLGERISSEYRYGFLKTAVIDERFEMSGMNGINCDVLRGYPKTEGIIHATRVLSPDVILCDEIASDEEAESVIKCMNSGVKFAVTLHSRSLEDLVNRPIAQKLIASGEFSYIALLKDAKKPGKFAEIIKTEEFIHANRSHFSGNRKLIFDGLFHYPERYDSLPESGESPESDSAHKKSGSFL